MNAFLGHATVEKAVIRSAAVLFTNPSEGQKQLTPFEALIHQRAAALQNEITMAYRLKAAQCKVQPVEPTMIPEEQQAAQLVVERVPVQGGGFGGGGGGGGRGGFGANQTPEQQVAQQALQKIPQHMRAELNILQNQKKTALEIRDFVAGEFDPLPLADLMTYLRAQEKAGTIKLTLQAAPARRR